MEQAAEGCLNSLKENASKLWKLGKEMSLTEEQIDECGKKAMSMEIVHDTSTGSEAEERSNSQLTCVAFANWLGIIGAILLVVLIGVYVVPSFVSEETTQEFIYLGLRWTRLFGVKLHRFWDAKTRSMGATMDDYLPKFTQNVADLRKLGGEWGIDETKINNCAEKALKAGIRKDGEKVTSPDMLRRVLTVLAGIFLVLGLILVLFNTDILNVLMQYAPFPQESMMTFNFYILSFFRKSFVPWREVFKIEQFYNMECIVENPLFATPPIDCEMCEDIKSVKELKVKVKQLKMQLFQYPIIHRGMTKSVTLGDIQDIIRNSRHLHLVDLPITSNVTSVTKVSNFVQEGLTETLLEKPEFHLRWNSQSDLLTGQMMRKLFPRPPILPFESEISLQKDVYIDGPKSPQYDLPESDGSYSWYAQGSGSRVIVFMPLKDCLTKCPEFKITMKKGDVLTYPAFSWNLRSAPKDEVEEISIGYIGHIMS